MATQMSNLLKLSFIVRKLTVKSNNAVRPIRFFRTSSYCSGKWLQDDDEQFHLPKSQLTTKPYKVFRLSRQIRECTTPVHVFHIVKQHGNHMNGYEAARALEAFYKLNMIDNSHHSNISTSKEFALLCDILESKITDVPINLIIMCLKVLNYFHVPTSTQLVEKLLEIISKSLDKASFEEMIFLCFILSKCQKTPMVETLITVLSIVLRSQVKSQLDAENIDSLVSCLCCFFYKLKNEDTVSFILDALNKVDESLIKPRDAKRVMAIIAHLDHDDTCIELLKKCQRILIDSIDDGNSNMVLGIANMMIPIINRSEDEYNDSFFDACATTVISKNMGLDTAINLLAVLNKVCHSHNSLLDYIAAKCFEDKVKEDKIHITAVRTIIAGMSLAEYKPVFWETLKDTLLTERIFMINPASLLKIGVNLATIDCYWPKLLAEIFTTEEMIRSPDVNHRLMLLDYAVKLYYPEYNGPRLPEETKKIIESSHKPLEGYSCIKPALDSALGGPQYVINNLRSVLDYNIDCVAIMRKGGFPIAVNNSEGCIPTHIEDLKPPQDSQVILFTYIPKFGCARNTQRLIGYRSFIIRTLKSLTNYTVIPIHYAIWCKLDESERVRYISQAIRLKCDELSVVFNR